MYAAIAIFAYCAVELGVADVTNFASITSNDYEDIVNNRQNGDDLPSSYDLLPGDYPTYKEVPRTSFSCRGKLHWNYYADIEAGCQAFHVCETEYSKISFLCPIGSVFNQLHLVCDWWYNVDCSESLYLYPLKEGVVDDGFQKLSEDSVTLDLNLASSGGNTDTNKSTGGGGGRGRNSKNNNV